MTQGLRGSEPLPLVGVFSRAALRLGQTEDGAPRVEIDPAAPASAKSLWQALVEGSMDLLEKTAL